ncbi:Hypothetical predicted protein [Cloeon dipterum]|uniref:Eukaryotic translation initiation factor 3 subunit M n=1 Tax=Cloeon dipterum TaxID=197152 RepID=A0A8S1C533_9INSE|nr:Hypothetical predicted protein [Cloeon dipterum]
MSVPVVFIDITLEEQAQELRSYLNHVGAEISEEMSPKGIEDDLHKIIGVCDACFKDSPDADVEKTLNSIVSILIQLPNDRSESLILAFCEKLTKAATGKLSAITLKVMWLLFQSLDETSPMRYHVYCHVIQAAKHAEQIKSVFHDVDQLKALFAACPPNNEQMQKLLRLLHDVLLTCNQSEQAAKVMMELLGTYTSENASQAREDAQRCIQAALADPNTFLLDPLLALKPVRFLQGQLIHDLLSIFVSEKLPSYLKFYQDHKEFVQSQGLNHEQNVKKMRLLTFMQLAESSSEMNFSKIQQELQLEEGEVESFVIDVLKTKLVRARMDQSSKKVYVSSTMHRTFGRQQWQQLNDLLVSWKSNLLSIQDNMKEVVEAQTTQ